MRGTPKRSNDDVFTIVVKIPKARTPFWRLVWTVYIASLLVGMYVVVTDATNIRSKVRFLLCIHYNKEGLQLKSPQMGPPVHLMMEQIGLPAHVVTTSSKREGIPQVFEGQVLTPRKITGPSHHNAKPVAKKVKSTKSTTKSKH